MCGIVAVLSHRIDRSAPTTAEVATLLATAAASVGSNPAEAATVLSSLDALLHGVPGVIAFKNDEHLVDIVTAALATIEAQVVDLESEVEAGTRADTGVTRKRMYRKGCSNSVAANSPQRIT